MSTDSIYDTPDGVEQYAAMAKGYDGRSHVERLVQLLPAGSEILEIGMGPGVDLDMLAATFRATGSDLSQQFLDRYTRIRPGSDVLRLDAVTIATDRRFDAIYSNKVLHHLTCDQMRRSLERQAEIIRPDGLLLHGIWAGTTAEDDAGLHDQRYLPATLASVVPPTLEVIEYDFYQEMSNDDSLRVVFRRARGAGDAEVLQELAK